ncbi:hypothetical protein Trydic_g14291 [Trypoxylus dichotomus]
MKQLVFLLVVCSIGLMSKSSHAVVARRCEHEGSGLDSIPYCFKNPDTGKIAVVFGNCDRLKYKCLYPPHRSISRRKRECWEEIKKAYI